MNDAALAHHLAQIVKIWRMNVLYIPDIEWREQNYRSIPDYVGQMDDIHLTWQLARRRNTSWNCPSRAIVVHNHRIDVWFARIATTMD